MQTPQRRHSLDGAQSINSDAVTGQWFVGLFDAEHDVVVEKDDSINESIHSMMRRSS